MKTKTFTLAIILFFFWGISSQLRAQASGDYVAIADGDYNSVATWGISDGVGGTTAATLAPTALINVWIPAGRSLTNTSSTALAKDLHVAGSLISGVSTSSTKDVTVNGNLYIESTGVLKSTSSNGGSVGTLKIGEALANGPCTIQVNGQLGSASLTDVVGSGFRTYCQAGGTTTVQGNGKFNIARFQSGNNTRTQTIVIDMDMNILNSANNGKTLSLENGNAGTATKTVVINEGKTVRFVDNSVNALLGSQSTEQMLHTTGNLTYDIRGTLNTGSQGGINLNTTSDTGSPNETITLKIGAEGKLILGTKIITKVAQATQAIVYDFAVGSTVEFAGATAAAFTSPGVGQTQSYMTAYYNLTANSPDGITFPYNFSISGTLNLNENLSGTTITLLPQANGNITTGKILTANTLNLNSSASGTATLVNNGTATVTTTNIQQYLPDARNWYVSSPVTGAVAPTGYTYYQRDEVASSWLSRPFAVDSIFLRGHGYIALPTTAPATLQFTGTLNSGNINTTLTKSGSGFNLIGNPYPCHLGWTYDFVNANSALIESSIWTRTTTGTNNINGTWSFATFNATSSESVPSVANAGIIPPMQAFWVKAKAAGTLTLDANLTKSHQGSNPLKAPALKNSDRQRLRLEISNGTITDETLLYFDADASNAYDAYDSPKFAETKDVQIYTTAETEKLVINGLNTITDNMLIPLGVKTAQSGTFTLKPIQLDNMPSDTKVYLVDCQSQTELELNKEYSFTSDVSDNTSRFSLLFKVPSLTTQIKDITNNKAEFNVYRNASGQLAITVYEAINATSKVTISNQLGQKLSERSLTATTSIVDEPLTAGVYFITVSSNGKSSTQKIIFN